MFNPDTAQINMERIVIIGGVLIILSILYKYLFNRKISILEFIIFIILVIFSIEKFNRKRPGLASLVKDSIEKIGV
jgi:hypothetical protein